MNELRDDGNCFVCGAGNGAGLRLIFRLDAASGTAEACVTFSDCFQGWAGVVHGGLLATLLDETMVKAATSRGLSCVTGELTVRYKKPSAVGAALTARGRVLERRNRIVICSAEVTNAGGETLAAASGKLFLV